jgi:pimeloyl-ACP methyl ester carboxylesterase
MARVRSMQVQIPLDGIPHSGDLIIPEAATGIVVFAHGSGSSRLSPRNRFVADTLHHATLATLLFDLLTEAEDRDYLNRFNIDLLADRLLGATAWVADEPALRGLKVGYFGASTGAAAALMAAAIGEHRIDAIVSRGGRPDLAATYLPRVQAPTMLIVGGFDEEVLALNRQAYALLRTTRTLEVVPGATHLFEEPGTLEQAAELATAWFARHLAPESRTP